MGPNNVSIIFSKVSMLDNVKQRETVQEEVCLVLSYKFMTILIKQVLRLVNTEFCMLVNSGGEGVPEVSGQIPLSVTKWIFGRPLILNYILYSLLFEFAHPKQPHLVGGTALI